MMPQTHDFEFGDMILAYTRLMRQMKKHDDVRKMLAIIDISVNLYGFMRRISFYSALCILHVSMQASFASLSRR